MCGINGIIAFNTKGQAFLPKIEASIQSLRLRGPDAFATYEHENVALGHARLSIIDTTAAANQPFFEEQNRYGIVFNGEIYNFKTIRNALINKGFHFTTNCDTEVLLKGYIHWGVAILSQLNGFFAFTIYDKQTGDLFIARDRMGIKPLLIYQDSDKLLFASELKALMAFGIPRVIDKASLYHYLQVNYVPSPFSILENVRKLEKGSYLFLSKKKEKGEEYTYDIKAEKYYEIPFPPKNKALKVVSYEQAQKQLVDVLTDSVRERLVADVPLGTFLSGGIDSSIITALAAQDIKNLNTFSVGFQDNALFDETHYANLVAQKYKTNHTVFSLKNQDLLDNFESVLDYLDEPFADSSALAVYILSQKTRQHVTVALSGDGADELFAGYNKHRAAFRVRQGGFTNQLVKWGQPLWKALPQSRSSTFGNLIRQLDRFATGAKLGHGDRYWQWASTMEEDLIDSLFKNNNFNKNVLNNRKSFFINKIKKNGNLNDELLVDMNLVLVGDMLRKVDSMSMANSLEVRTPFLAHQVVDFAFGLPVSYKIDGKLKKKIVQDAFRDKLPSELYNRPKQGFEVPLLEWMRTDLKDLIVNDLLSKDFVEAQNLFDYQVIKLLLDRLFSANPQNVTWNIWALIVFQTWWKKYLS